MKEKIKQFSQEEGSVDFDREAEKEKRKEVRKILEKAISESLAEEGFEKIGNSNWCRRFGDAWQMIYLQRSQFSHSYYIEAGVVSVKEIGDAKKMDITFCPIRERVEYVVEKQYLKDGCKETEARKKRGEIDDALNFEISGARDKYPDEYFVPSVSIAEAQNKIKFLQQTIKEYIPAWFNQHKV